MMFVVKPLLKRIGEIYKNSEVVNKSVFAFFLLVLITSSYITQLIGIHALFGAFLAGVIMPPLPSFRKLIVDKVEDVSLTLLLPLFFVYTGLRTEIGLLNTPYLWWIALIFIVVAVVGKFIGSAFSAKLLGETWKDSLSIGILMNTRGLMELIVLNIGYEMGVLPPPIFVMLVLITSSYITQLIGIHALFGAFLAGVIMPPLPSFRKLIVDKVEDVSLTLLLPLFFVYTGLRTEIGLLNTPYLWWIALIFIVVAVVGKFIGSAFSAKAPIVTGKQIGRAHV